MGYAENRGDLGRGDEMNGVLHTGDLAYRDQDGYFFVTGRMKRFLKIFGLRLNLDDVEEALESHLSKAVVCAGSDDELKNCCGNERTQKIWKKRAIISLICTAFITALSIPQALISCHAQVPVKKIIRK